MAYMTMLDREVVVMTHSQIRGQMEVMLEADGFYFKFGMEMSSKTAFWFLFGMNISNTIHFMLFLRKKENVRILSIHPVLMWLPMINLRHFNAIYAADFYLH